MILILDNVDFASLALQVAHVSYYEASMEGPL